MQYKIFTLAISQSKETFEKRDHSHQLGPIWYLYFWLLIRTMLLLLFHSCGQAEYMLIMSIKTKHFFLAYVSRFEENYLYRIYLLRVYASCQTFDPNITRAYFLRSQNLPWMLFMFSEAYIKEYWFIETYSSWLLSQCINAVAHLIDCEIFPYSITTRSTCIGRFRVGIVCVTIPASISILIRDEDFTRTLFCRPIETEVHVQWNH